jgi:signal peptidase I
VLAIVAGAVTILATVRTFTEPSTSMENTVRPGDLVVADRTAQVRRGDVIVEQQPSAGSGYFLRRVIGLPGDHVACCDARGRVTVDGKPLTETYLYPGDAPARNPFSITVPSGKLWLMGDHRSVSYDSRELGPLAARVTGRAFLIIRRGHVTFLRTPPTFSAQGLAPADGRTPPALIGAYAAGAGLPVLLVLIIFGVIRQAVLVRRRRRAETR